jgi:DNA-binding transcriptional ArsR family regulator
LPNLRAKFPIYMFVCTCKHACMDEPVHSRVRRPLSLDTAQDIARLMGALSTASRVRILARLRVSPCAVGELSAELEMEQPAVSHQLRVLRDLGLVVGDRSGRSVVYGLFDSHVASLIDEALRHIDHVTARSGGDAGDKPTSPTKDHHQAEEATA